MTPPRRPVKNVNIVSVAERPAKGLYSIASELPQILWRGVTVTVLLGELARRGAVVIAWLLTEADHIADDGGEGVVGDFIHEAIFGVRAWCSTSR